MNLLFDLDGTLADPFESIKNSLTYAFQRQSLPVPPDSMIRKCIGPPLQDSLVRILSLPTSKAEQALKDFRQHHQDHCVADYRLYPETSETLKSLTPQHRLYVATSKPQVFARPILQHHGLAPTFKEIYGSELSGVRSAKSDLIKFILENENLDPSQTVMIGDREHDAIGARNNNIPFIGVAWGYGSEEELGQFKNLFLARNWQDFLNRL